MKISALNLMPHKPPMAMIDTLVKNSPECKIAETVIKHDNRFLNSDGILDPTTIPELVAQAAAACDTQNNNGIIRRGFLAMAKDIVIEQEIHAGDHIIITASDTSPLENWFVITFTITRQDGTSCSHGEISVCII